MLRFVTTLLRNLCNAIKPKEQMSLVIEPINFSGEKGENLYSDIFRDRELFASVIPAAQADFEKTQAEYESITDDRTLAIVGALLIEEKLDEFIAVYIPGHKKLSKEKDFTFSFKVRVASACHIIPNRILNSIEVIRKIRNDFAHKLDIKTFEEYVAYDIAKSGQKVVPKVEPRLKAFGNFFKDDLRQDFKQLVRLIRYALVFYTIQLRKYTDKCRNDEFVSKIYGDVKLMQETKDGTPPKAISAEKLVDHKKVTKHNNRS